MRFTIKDLPKGDFKAKDIATKFYSECVKFDSEGRLFNRALPVVYRILRKMKGVIEIGNGIFYR